MGHLPLADRADPAANAPAVAGMHEAQQAVRAAGLGSPLAHLAATSGTLTDPATHFGMVRVGADWSVSIPPGPWRCTARPV
jgi:alanine racemase